jgi:beta-glucosidase-like glycosyl hydrolase
MLRELGFEGVAMTDSLDVVRGHAREWAVAAARAGADLLLFTNGRDAARAIRVLLPLARSGELDDQVQRVLRFRAELR